MPRFEVEIEGSDLERAMRSLNDAGIPTIGTTWGAPASASQPSSGRIMLRRLLRSRAIPILVVIVAAFVIKRVLDPGHGDSTTDGDGGIVASLLLYAIPFLLFFVFYVYLIRQSRRARAAGAAPLAALRAVIDADSAHGAKAEVRAALPADGDYRAGWVKRA